MKMEPGKIGGGLGVVGAIGRITVFLVEIDTVTAGVAENPVEKNADSPFFSFPAQKAEILPDAQQRIDTGIIGGIIPVVGVGLKDWVEIKAGDTKGREVIQVGEDSPEISPEIIVVDKFPIFWTLFVLRCPEGLSAPVISEDPVVGDVFLLCT